MKIFNNFDTNQKLREYDEATRKYGKNGVIFMQKHISYFIIKGLIPFVLFMLISTIIIIFSYLYFINYPEIIRVIVGANTGIGFMFFKILIYRFMDLKMDYSIITKEGISTYKQLGILENKYKTIPANQIRSIVSGREGLLGNICGYGFIEFISDGGLVGKDSQGQNLAGKLIMTYVNNPDFMRKQIMDLCFAGEARISKFDTKEFL